MIKEESADVTVEGLIAAAHTQAQKSGFWESKNVGEKLALIATEVDEFQGAFGGMGDPLEEVADIVIRTFDLCGYLGIDLPHDVLCYYDGVYLSPRDFALLIYQRAARATQAHRKDEPAAVRLWLLRLVHYCARYATEHFGQGELERAILEKMQKNARRPHKHGRLY